MYPNIYPNLGVFSASACFFSCCSFKKLTPWERRSRPRCDVEELNEANEEENQIHKHHHWLNSSNTADEEENKTHKIQVMETGWWFQPLWKNMSQNGNLPQMWVKIKNI